MIRADFLAFAGFFPNYNGPKSNKNMFYVLFLRTNNTNNPSPILYPVEFGSAGFTGFAGFYRFHALEPDPVLGAVLLWSF